MIRAVLIDIDNTVLDFDAFVRETMRKGFRQFSLRPYEEWMFPVFCKVNDTLWRGIEKGELTMEDVKLHRWQRIFEELDIHCDGPSFETFFRDELHESTIFVEGAEEAVRYLAGKYCLAAASNGPHEQQVYRIRKAGLASCFSHIFISERLGVSKPDPLFFRRCLEEMNTAAHISGEIPFRREEVLMIGDSLTADMAGAGSFGLKTCYYDRKKKELPDPPTDYYVQDLHQIPSLL